MLKEHFFAAISLREQVAFDYDNICLVEFP